ncbi:MAG: hypothetical protein HY036_03240 [Nitrospirae bacterium]|nr:hypothetical protein [Nitrospirota bacterium]MBI3351570.1 hypothetical protein [Nitrospirota bacterium]
MKKTLILTALSLLFFNGAVFLPRDVKAEEIVRIAEAFQRDLAQPSGDKTEERKTTLRESEILGTLENPQLSTKLPWKSPEGLNENAAPLHRSFIKEIFRPVAPLEDETQKMKQN